jgi:hypothetical protein
MIEIFNKACFYILKMFFFPSCLVWDEDVLNVEHVLTFMTVLGACVAGARVFIPDENLG